MEKPCFGPECVSGTSASQLAVFQQMMIHVQEDPDRHRTEEMIALVAQEIRRDRRQSIDDVVTLLCISHGFVQSILHNDLKMQRVCEHIVPRSLTDE
ncbi:hypothetical protein ANN_03742 [Periplaneta americana]|uniref:Uncharacterized protein n=1 Tax=Periplaneta americana TaxID=6978 RepID=A0ABQ8U4A5_PERAM|nr:hypothetical protein ANN_03742 [Periplaneta americana]